MTSLVHSPINIMCKLASYWLNTIQFIITSITIPTNLNLQVFYQSLWQHILCIDTSNYPQRFKQMVQLFSNSLHQFSYILYSSRWNQFHYSSQIRSMNQRHKVPKWMLHNNVPDWKRHAICLFSFIFFSFERVTDWFGCHRI